MLGSAFGARRSQLTPLPSSIFGRFSGCCTTPSGEAGGLFVRNRGLSARRWAGEGDLAQRETELARNREQRRRRRIGLTFLDLRDVRRRDADPAGKLTDPDVLAEPCFAEPRPEVRTGIAATEPRYGSWAKYCRTSAPVPVSEQTKTLTLAPDCSRIQASCGVYSAVCLTPISQGVYTRKHHEARELRIPPGARLR